MTQSIYTRTIHISGKIKTVSGEIIVIMNDRSEPIHKESIIETDRAYRIAYKTVDKWTHRVKFVIGTKVWLDVKGLESESAVLKTVQDNDKKFTNAVDAEANLTTAKTFRDQLADLGFSGFLA